MLCHISSVNVAVNRRLKDLAALIETNVHLSFHVSWHSFADFACTSGVDLYPISKVLGHSNLKITETYLSSLDHSADDGALAQLFGTHERSAKDT